ncbi:MAG TPA: glycosyltransferase family 4 protein [Candidatus Acidoferrales bacterium]|nr:glycosyltransferase family 4 protein [Candidatus Acidoferrales bacterium]
MRVIYWSSQYWPSIGGVEILAAEFVRAMSVRGFDFNVVTGHGNHALPDADTHDGVAIHRFPLLQAIEDRDLDALVRATKGLAQLKRQVRPQLVHFQLSDASALFHLRTQLVQPAPTLVSVHVAPPRRLLQQSILADLLSTADWITTASRAIADDITALLPSVAARLSVFPPVIPLPSLAPSPLITSPATLLCLGRLVEDKGFDLALAALPCVLTEFPQTRLLVAGDGAARAALERQAAQLGIGQAVDFLGWVAPADVPALINRSSLVLVPSRWREAFGIVALQAAQMGRPVICSDRGGLPEVVEHERSGLVVDIGEHGALDAAILRLLRHPDEAERLGASGRRRAVEHFNWEKQLDDYEALYRRLAAAAGDDRATS